jgi:hypothetical protein
MYFLSSGERREPVFDPDAVSQAVRSLWPYATVSERSDDAGSYTHVWSVRTGGDVIEVRLNRRRDTVVVDADLADAAELAVAVRRALGSGPELVLFDEQNTAVVPVGETTSTSEIVAAFT